MSDNRTRSQDRLDWLDDDAAERLLRGEVADARAERLARLLAAAARPSAVDPAREEAALTAFRTVRDEGVLAAESRIRGLARLRGRRPGGVRRAVRPARVLAGALVATAALGGVAVAGGALPTPFGGGTSWPVLIRSADGSGQGTSAVPGGTYSATPDRDRPAGGTSRGVPSPTAGAVAAGKLCRAYSAAKKGGEEMDGGSYQQLERTAGGRQAMYGYCAGLLSWNPAGSWTQPGTEAGTSTDSGTGSDKGSGSDADKTPSSTNGSDQQSQDDGGSSSGNGGPDTSAGGNGSNSRNDSGDGTGQGSGNGMSGDGSDGAGQGN